MFFRRLGQLVQMLGQRLEVDPQIVQFAIGTEFQRIAEFVERSGSSAALPWRSITGTMKSTDVPF